MSGIGPRSFDNSATTGAKTTPSKVSVTSYPTQSPTQTTLAASGPTPRHPAASANTGSGWKLAAIIFCLTTIVAVIGWVKTYGSLRQWTSAHDQVRSSHSSELQQVEALKRDADRLRGENDRLRQQVRNLTNENDGLSNRVKELGNENDGLSNRVEELRKDLNNEKQAHQRHH
jgi:uncharacterized protein YoxC